MAGHGGLRPVEVRALPRRPAVVHGRRVDLLGRSLDVPLGTNPADALRGYLAAARTATARALAAKAIVLIFPEHLVGEIVWPAAGILR